jgi:uncharacterized membrane protein
MTAQEHLNEIKRSLNKVPPKELGKMFRKHYHLLNDRNEESETTVKKLAQYDLDNPGSIFDGNVPLTFNVK